MDKKSNYKPIDCNFYDRLEAWSVRKVEVNICLTDTDSLTTGVIQDLYIKEKAEFLLLNTGQEIRLDKIASVNGIPLDETCDY